MPAPRRRPALDEGVRATVPLGLAVSVGVSPQDDQAAVTLARTAVTLAASLQGAVAIISRRSAMGAALRGARDSGVEPRVSLPSPSASLSARTPLTLALQGPRSSPAFAAAAAFVADFVAKQVAGKDAPPDAALRGKILQSVAKAREATRTVLDFAAVGAYASKAVDPSGAARSEVVSAFSALESAEAAARAFGAPASWDALLGPSPTGRRAALFIDLGKLLPSDASRVEGLALASLAASLEQVQDALEGGPVLVVADAPEDALGVFAVKRLASWRKGDSPSVFALMLASPSAPQPPDFPKATWGDGALQLPGRELPLALSPSPESLLPLSDAEVRALTPPALRSRLLGGAALDEEEAAQDPLDALAPSAGASENQRALEEATAALDAIAKRRTKPALTSPVKRPRDYEASDFEL
jgi:hypothetical protein